MGCLGMVSDWIVIMCLTCAISKFQVSSAKGLEQKAEDYTTSCNVGRCNQDYFLALAPCPPPTKTHLLCDIPSNLGCRERTIILGNCIEDLSQDAIYEVFKTCNQSLEVQCEDFFSLCKNVSRFNCGRPQIIKPSPTAVPPQVIFTSTPTYDDVTNSYMNDSDLGVWVTRDRPELPVLNAGSGDKNWWPLLSLLVVPPLVAIVYVCFARKRRDSRNLKATDNVQEKLIETEMQRTEEKNKRDTCISQDELFAGIPYIDEDRYRVNTEELDSCVDDPSKIIDTNEQY